MSVAPDRRRFVAGLVLAGAGAARAAEPLARGQALAWPALTLLDGRVLAAADWADTAAVLVFWATWCGYCKRHNARIEQLHQASADKRLRVLGVAVESDEAEVRRLVPAQGLHFAVTLGAPALRAQISTRRSVPLTALVDRRGRLVQVIPGEMSLPDVMALAELARG